MKLTLFLLLISLLSYNNNASYAYFESYGWPTYGIVKPFWMSFFSFHPSSWFTKYSRKHHVISAGIIGEMTCESPFIPPKIVSEMKTLDESKFLKKISIPYVEIDAKYFEKATIMLKPYYFSMPGLKGVEDIGENKRNILLDPLKISSFNDFPNDQKIYLNNVCKIDKIHHKDIIIGFENYSTDAVMKAVIPNEQSRIASWSIIGHILHVNLGERNLDKKHLIGDILLRKNQPKIKMVVNKVNKISSEFRNLDWEILAQTNDASDLGTIVQVFANRCTFKFDFAKVYWNPRLNTEHERIYKILNKNDVVYDVFAGVGPFSVPAAKKGCKVLANDLNPDAYKWLQENRKLNKIENNLFVYNMDGKEFIRKIIKKDLIQEWLRKDIEELVVKPAYHVIMNLPQRAIDFLDVFKGLMLEEECTKVILPKIYVYSFVSKSGEEIKIIKKNIEQTLDYPINEMEFQEVRSVSPNVLMFRASFLIPSEVLFQKLTYKKQKTA